MRCICLFHCRPKLYSPSSFFNFLSLFLTLSTQFSSAVCFSSKGFPKKIQLFTLFINKCFLEKPIARFKNKLLKYIVLSTHPRRPSLQVSVDQPKMNVNTDSSIKYRDYEAWSKTLTSFWNSPQSFTLLLDMYKIWKMFKVKTRKE